MRWRSAAVLLAASLLGAALATAWVAAPPRPPVYRNFQSPLAVKGKPTRWARPHAKVKVPERGFRPLRISLSLIAPEAAPRGAAVVLLVDGVPARSVQARPEWTEVTLEIGRPSATPGHVWLELDSELFGPDQQGVGLADLRSRPSLAAWPIAPLAAGGLLAGVGLWLALPASRLERARIARGWRAARAPGSGVNPAVWGLPLCTLAALVPVMRPGEGTAAVNALFLTCAVLVLALFGRWLAITCESGLGPAAFPAYRNPVFEFLVGLSSAALLLYAASFALKRLFGRQQPLPDLFPSLLVGALLVACLSAVRCARRPQPGTATRPVLWRPAEYLEIALFLGTCVWLGRRELGALFGFSTDPDQHIFWANQIASFGYVPDVSRGTDLWLAYPLGFHALATALAGFTPLYAATAVNVLPTLASTAFLFLMLETAVAVAGGSHSRRPSSPLEIGSRALLFVALAAAFDSARYGWWDFLEGTGRRAAGLLHAVPVVVLGAALGRAAPAEDRSRRGLAALVVTAVALALSTVLVFELNPVHAPAQGLLAALALAGLGWRTLRQRDAASEGPVRHPVRRLSGAVALGALLASSVMLADPYSYRALGRATGWWSVDDAAVVRADAEFNRGLTGRSCLEWSCLVHAADPAALASAFGQPLAALALGPLRSPEWLRAAVRSPPDLLGSGAVPVHGWITVGLLIVPWAVLLTWRVQRPEYRRAVVVAVLACAAASAAQMWLGRVIDPSDPRLRLLPGYAAGAASVLSTQTIWPLLIAGLWTVLDRLPRRWWAVVARAAMAAGLVAVAISAAGDLWARASRLPRRDISRQDLRDLWRLEGEVMHGRASYFVSSRAQSLNGENWRFPDDASTPLYTQSSRPSLFLYRLSLGGRYTAAEAARVCAELNGGNPQPRELVENDARWMAVLAPVPEAADQAARQRRFCGRPVGELFPGYRRVASRGRVALYRLF